MAGEIPLEKAEKREEIHHLIFLPDGPLLQLSFDVLVLDNTSTTPHYLLKDYAISYAYSNRLLFGYSAKKEPDTPLPVSAWNTMIIPWQTWPLT